MLNLRSVQSALEQLEEDRGISRESIVETIEMALASAYKKDYGKKGQIIRATFNMETGEVAFSQIKIVVDESMLKEDEDSENDAIENIEDSEEKDGDENEEDKRVRFNPEHHIMIDEAKRVRGNVEPGDELSFPLETRSDYGRIAAQTAKQVIIQRIREEERANVFEAYKGREGEIVSGIVQRVESNNVFIDLDKAGAILPREEQLTGERYRMGERTRALLYLVEQTPRGVNLYLSRSHPKFALKLFELEVPEIAAGTVEILAIAREAGSRSKIAVMSHENGVDPVGACVGQKGVRVSTIISELGGEKIDIIEWSENAEEFVGNSLSPARVLDVELNEKEKQAVATVDEDQLSLAIGKGGQNVRLAAKLTGWKIDVKSRDEINN